MQLALLAVGVVSVSLLVASYVVFPPGTTLTCHATFAISDTLLAHETFQHMYPGHMSIEPFEHRLLYATEVGFLVGTPSGLILRALGSVADLTRSALLGLGIACFLEYTLESLLLLMLNSHYPDASLVAFSVDAAMFFEVALNVASAVLMHTLQPLGDTGLYVILTIPPIGGIIGLLLAKKITTVNDTIE